MRVHKTKALQKSEGAVHTPGQAQAATAHQTGCESPTGVSHLPEARPGLASEDEQRGLGHSQTEARKLQKLCPPLPPLWDHPGDGTDAWPGT